MHALCTEAADRITVLEHALVEAEAIIQNASADLRRQGNALATHAHQLNQLTDPRSTDAVFSRE